MVSSIRIKVSATILSTASNVFEAMLKPNFKEGKELAVAATVDIDLPDDPPMATEILCRVLHYQNNQLPAIDPRLALALAIQADKYDCVVALQPSAHYWLDRDARKETIADKRNLLTAAYLFRDTKRFSTWASELILGTSYNIWPAGDSETAVLRKVFGKRSSI